jgi:hypothetical protein
MWTRVALNCVLMAALPEARDRFLFLGRRYPCYLRASCRVNSVAGPAGGTVPAVARPRVRFSSIFAVSECERMRSSCAKWSRPVSSEARGGPRFQGGRVPRGSAFAPLLRPYGRGGVLPRRHQTSTTRTRVWPRASTNGSGCPVGMTKEVLGAVARRSRSARRLGRKHRTRGRRRRSHGATIERWSQRISYSSCESRRL